MKDQRLGEFQVVLAAVCWSFAGVFCKYIPWSAVTIIGFRGLIASIMLGLAKGGFKVNLTKANVLGAFGMAATSVLFLSATKLTTSANAIALQYAMPIFVLLFGFIAFREKPSALEAVATLCVLSGVVLCSWTGLTYGGGRFIGDLMAIISAVTYALVYFSVRLPGANSGEYVYLGALLNAPLLLYAPFDAAFTINLKYAACILAMSACFAGGYFFISRSLRRVSPIKSAILSNLEPILNPLWVYIFIGEDPGIYTIIGAAVVIVSATAYSILSVRKTAKRALT